MRVFRAVTEPEASQRQSVTFAGLVQGVGFRYTTHAVARRYAVTGFVENLPDGRVLLVAEGAPAAVRDFVAAVEHEMSTYIRQKQVETSAATGEFERFSVRH